MLIITAMFAANIVNWGIVRMSPGTATINPTKGRAFYLSEFLAAILFVAGYVAIQVRLFHDDAVLSTVIALTTLILGWAVFWRRSRSGFRSVARRWLALLCCLAFGCGASHTLGNLLYNTVTSYRSGTTNGFGEFSGNIINITASDDKDDQQFYEDAFQSVDAFLRSQGFEIESDLKTRRRYHGTADDSPPFDVEVLLVADSREANMRQSGVSADVIWKVRGSKTYVDSSVVKFDAFAKVLNNWWVEYTKAKGRTETRFDHIDY